MRLRELRERVDPLPARDTLRRLLPSWDDSQPVGVNRDYTEEEVELILAWQRVTDLLGLAKNEEQQRLHRRIARLLVRAPEGYIVVQDGSVWWSLHEPVGVIRRGVAACWKVNG